MSCEPFRVKGFMELARIAAQIEQPRYAEWFTPIDKSEEFEMLYLLLEELVNANLPIIVTTGEHKGRKLKWVCFAPIEGDFLPRKGKEIYSYEKQRSR